MKFKPVLGLGMMLLALGLACNLPVAAAKITATPADTPVALPSATPFGALVTMNPLPTLAQTGQPTDTPQGGCSYQTASNPLADLSSQLQDMYNQAGFSNLHVEADAYGENCILADGSQGGFTQTETDLKFVLDEDSLDDSTVLAVQAHEILRIIAGMPEDQLPGPNPGYIGITFQTSKGDTLQYWFPRQVGLNAFQQGLSGDDLLKALQQNQ